MKNYWKKAISRWSSQPPAAVAFADAKSAISFPALEDFANGLEDFFKSNGLNQGSRIIMFIPQSVASAAIMFSVLQAGIVGLWLTRKQTQKELPDLFSMVAPSALLVMKEDLGFFTSALGAIGAGAEQIRLSSLKDVTSEFVLIKLQPSSFVASPDELGWLLQTSGSTGTPRICMIGRESLVARALGEIRDFQLSPGERVLCNLSFAHDLGLNQFLTTIAGGTSLTLQNRPFISALAEILLRNEHDGVTGTPLMWQQIIQQFPNVTSRLRYLSVSGGSMAFEDLKKLAAMFPRTEIIRTYGQSETFRTLLNRDTEDSSTGKPIAGVAAFLIDENGHACARGHTGELIHQGEGSMLGYFGDVPATEDRNFHLGVRTGDFFVQNDDGAFAYIGRRDDIVKRFDTRLHLGEVEKAIAQHPAVERVAVVSKSATDKTDIRQTLLCAYVLSRNGSEVSEKSLLTFCKEVLSPLKSPDAIKLLSVMPQTESYKIDRQALKKMWNESFE